MVVTVFINLKGALFFAYGISVKIKKILNKCNKNISSVNLSYFKLQGILFYLVLLVVFFQIFIEQRDCWVLVLFAKSYFCMFLKLLSAWVSS